MFHKMSMTLSKESTCMVAERGGAGGNGLLIVFYDCACGIKHKKDVLRFENVEV